MLQVQRLRKSYGATTVLADVSFVLTDGERVGLVGDNGTGKSTLLRCLAGHEEPDAGVIVLSPPTATIGYLAQSFSELTDRTVGNLIASAQGDFAGAEADLRAATEELANAPAQPAALVRYDAALARFEALGGYAREHRVAAVLQGLDLVEVDFATPVAALSGGQKTRLGLATLLLAEPDLVLLDEPTNHLDVDGLEWLEQFVRGYAGSVLIVSHDREFLDHTVSRVLYLDSDTRSIASYPGNYSDFALARAREGERQVELWKRQEEYVDQVERDVARLKGEALAIERGTSSRQPNVRRLARKKARLAISRERKLERYLESDERIDKPRLRWNLKLDFGEPPPGGRAVLRVENVAFAYPERPNLFSGVSLDVRHGQRIGLVGPNGAGKTTLLRLIDGRLEPTAGRVQVGSNLRLGTLTQEQETLDPGQTVLEAALRERPMSETEARSFLHFFLFGGDSVFRRIAECSLGERSRLQLALLVMRGCNLLLLDEPLNHLDIAGREHFTAALDAFAGTVIAVAHDRAFLRHFAQRVVEVRSSGIRVFEGGYAYYLSHRGDDGSPPTALGVR